MYYPWQMHFKEVIFYGTFKKLFFMIAIKQNLSLFIFFLIILTSCKKDVATTEAANEEIATGKPTPPPPPQFMVFVIMILMKLPSLSRMDKIF
jgi:hypothetical protein